MICGAEIYTLKFVFIVVTRSTTVAAAVARNKRLT